MQDSSDEDYTFVSNLCYSNMSGFGQDQEMQGQELQESHKYAIEEEWEDSTMDAPGFVSTACLKMWETTVETSFSLL
jgi:hypothetical protein